MKIRAYIALASLMVFAGAALFAEETDSHESQEAQTAKQVVSLDDYIALVEKNNKDLKIATQNSVQAKMQMRQAMAALLPNAGVQLGYTRNLTDIEKPTSIGVYAPAALQATGVTSGFMTHDGAVQPCAEKLPTRSSSPRLRRIFRRSRRISRWPTVRWAVWTSSWGKSMMTGTTTTTRRLCLA